MDTSLTHTRGDKIHQCSTCFKSYKRREHLQRHQATHTADRPHRCPACARSFQRADVLRRHLRSCDGAFPAISQSTTRQRACDRCVQQKKACNNTQPCQNCSKRGLSCLYPVSAPTPRPLEEFSASSTSAIIPNPGGTVDRPHEQLLTTGSSFFDFPDLDLFPSPDQTWQDLFSLNEHEANPTTVDYPYFFQFLDTFTSKSGFVSTFECGTLEQRQSVLAHVYRDEQEDWHAAMLSPYDESSGALPDVSSRWLNDPLSLQTHQILLLIKEVVTIRPRNSCVRMTWSAEVEQRCVQFFSPINLRKYLEFYWSIWSSNISCIHRPSFDPASCKPILLACMAIIGACVSSDEEDNASVRPWFNCIEEAVFADDDFNRDPIAPFQPTRDRPKIQALQAAYMVCLYQNWEGTDANKKRVRRNRFSSVVSAVRDIDITMARHINYNLLQSDEFDWDEFVVREELIRTIMWIFLMDTAFVTFNNNPPRMVAKEMKMHVAAPDACFQAPTADLCFEQIQRWMPSTALCWKVSFRSLFESLCLDDLTGIMRHSVAALGPLNLFLIISGIHSLVFQYQSFFSAGHLLLRTHNALRNFKDIWHIYQADFIGRLPHTTIDESSLTPDNMWQRVGFCRHAGDYWLLAKVKVDRLSAADELQNSNQEAGAVGHDGDEPADPILNKYDQTSMRQVNDLISDFQKVHLEEPAS